MRSKPTTTTVDVLEAERPLYGYTEDDEGHYSRTRLGMMTTREFQGEDVNRLYYRPAIVTPGDDDTQKTYTMGHVSDQFQVIDHAEVLKPLIAIGYTIVKIHYHRGGLNMLATLEPAKPLTLKDPLRWDKGQWDDSHNSGTIRESLFVTSGMKPGRGIHLRRGWFRQICTNGLVAEILSLGSANFSHSSWSADNLRETVRRRWPALKSGTDAQGPLVGNTQGVRRFGEVLSALNDTRTADDLFDEDDEDTDRSRTRIRNQATSKVSANLPLFVRDELMTFSASPAWLLVAMVQQLALFAEQSRTESFFALDLVNVYTNAVNSSVQDNENRSAFRHLTRMENSIQSAMKLIGGFSM